jgi:hypothetical protein
MGSVHVGPPWKSRLQLGLASGWLRGELQTSRETGAKLHNLIGGEWPQVTGESLTNFYCYRFLQLSNLSPKRQTMAPSTSPPLSRRIYKLLLQGGSRPSRACENLVHVLAMAVS